MIKFTDLENKFEDFSFLIDFYNNYKNMFTFVKESENYIKQLNLNIDLEKLKYIRDTGWLLIAAGHFLKKFSAKIRS